ncbi:MAG: hypothetical protein BM485_12510 [Desulfobulbaceae bacterium DB1]|nr:MAG: hypothetical protein BM485_12510 [Desulfobulbaceae bacterium DB1]
MRTLYYIGLDVHKKLIAYCIKTLDGRIVGQGMIGADRMSVGEWVNGLPGLWVGAMEATIFTGWIYDFLSPHAVEVKVAHPQMLKAITTAKKKNDRADAAMLADLLNLGSSLLLAHCRGERNEHDEKIRRPRFVEQRLEVVHFLLPFLGYFYVASDKPKS